MNLLLCWIFGISSKFWISAEVQKEKSLNPFVTDKINFIWSKAMHHLSEASSLKKIKADLAKFDSLYLAAKKENAQNLISKLSTAQIDEKLERLLEGYNIQSTISAYNKKLKWAQDIDANEVVVSEDFADESLNKLWKLALKLKSKFSEVQLRVFLSDLKECEKNMSIYDEQIIRYNELRAIDDADEDNHLHTDFSSEIHELRNSMKENNRNIQNAIAELHSKIAEREKWLFSNEKVGELWQMASKNGNISPNEVEMIRVELQALDKQMNKLAFHEQELRQAQVLNKASSKVDDIHDDNLSLFMEKSERFQRKIRKLEHFLESRIVHSEL